MLFREFISKEMNTDPAHDINHIMRVVQTSKRLCLQEKANSKVIIPAAYLHDCYTLPRNTFQTFIMQLSPTVSVQI